MILRKMWLLSMATLIMLWWGPAAQAGGPVETSVFAVQGVEVDVTDKDAASAKNKALIDVQMKAIVMLAQRLGNESLATVISRMNAEEVLPLLKSLSIEEESTGPGRYIGKFTVRFLPTKIYNLFAQYGVTVAADQAIPMLVIPVWKVGDQVVLWEDNPWRQAWINLHAEQSQVPLIIPLGDLEDANAVTIEDVLELAPVKLEALRRRYGAKTILVTTAEATADGGVRASMSGNSELGNIKFDKTFTSDPPTVESSATLAASRFHAVMVDKYRADKQKAVAPAVDDGSTGGDGESSSIPVAVPFSSPSEWNRIRSRILSTPDIIGVDVSTLAGNGAVIRLMYVGDLTDIQSAVQEMGLKLEKVGGSWVIQPLQ